MVPPPRDIAGQGLVPASLCRQQRVVRPDAAADLRVCRPVGVRWIEEGQESALGFDFLRASKALLAFFTMSVDIAVIGLAEEKQPSVPAAGASANVIVRHGAMVDGAACKVQA